MASEEQASILRSGVGPWNRWRKANPEEFPDLYKADLSELELSGANLRNATLSEASFRHANLERAMLRGAHANEADFDGASLKRANLEACVLIKARLSDTDLTDAWMRRVDLRGANVTAANLEHADLEGAVLILGRFTPERKPTLDAIRDELRKRDYVPVIFDFDVPDSLDTHETITTLARMARFVIADISEAKSIPQELVSIVEQLPSLPVQPIIAEDSEPWGMYDHIKRYPWVLALKRYTSGGALIARIHEDVIAPSEAYRRNH
jgi:uncharacterized protein YjbI with pentapeptide repeats